MIDSVYKIDKNYYPQVFLEECKYVVQEKKKSKFITDNIEIYSDDSDEENSNEENEIYFFLKKYNEVSGFASSLLKYPKVFKLGIQNITNIRSFFGGFCFLKYKEFSLGGLFFIFRAWDEKCRVSFGKI